MSRILPFRLFLESARGGENKLEMTSRLFPVLGEHVRELDSEMFIDGNDEDDPDFWDAAHWDEAGFQARITEVLNEYFKQNITEELVSLGIGITDVVVAGFNEKGTELYYDLLMEQDWRETITELIEGIRPAKLDAFLSQRFKSRAGFISSMPQSKHALLNGFRLDERRDGDVELAMGALLQFLVDGAQTEEWGEGAVSLCRDRVSAYEFNSAPGTADEDDELGELDEENE